jgi:phosphatidylserine decarboxylase
MAMIRIHREGRWIVAGTMVILLIGVVVCALTLPYQFNYLISAASVVILVLVLRFFRVPVRHFFVDEKSVVAPADGKVVAIERVYQEEFLESDCIQVSIFMSIHDVHVNYMPVSGTVRYLRYHPGKYLVARHPKSSSLNERFSTGIVTAEGPLLVRQVAGYVARRIRCYATLDQQVRQAEELGFIKFGSRLDLFLPLEMEVKVNLHEKVMGGITTVARFR